MDGKTYIWSAVTYISIVHGGSHPAVNVVDVTGRTRDQGGTSIHNSLASTTASNNLSIDGDAWGKNRTPNTVTVVAFCKFSTWIWYNINNPSKEICSYLKTVEKKTVVTCPRWSASMSQRTEGSRPENQCSGWGCIHRKLAHCLFESCWGWRTWPCQIIYLKFEGLIHGPL